MRLRIATFNVENLAARNSYGPVERPETAPALSLFDFPEAETRDTVQASVAVAVEDDKRELTGLAIAETRADILALQEIDNLGVLQAFFANYVHRVSDTTYGHFKLVNGNDPRGIDVAFAARRDLVDSSCVKARSYHETTFGELGLHTPALEARGIGADALVFNRDCLEVTLDLGEADLTMFLCHFKAKSYRKDGSETTLDIREAEAKAVRRIVENRFGEAWCDANWIVAGDLNDLRSRILPGGAVAGCTATPIDVLFDDFGFNVMDALPEAERWTYFHRDKSNPEAGVQEEHVQLDYLLLSPALAAANPKPHVEVLRRGLPYRVPLDPAVPDRSIAYLSSRNDRYPRVGWDRPKASDHCPVVVELEIPARTSSPAKRGRGTARSAVEGATTRPVPGATHEAAEPKASARKPASTGAVAARSSASGGPPPPLRGGGC
jgi:endonuclease/exonuclease/phosphatase family metal-dependent hydrolase